MTKLDNDCSDIYTLVETALEFISKINRRFGRIFDFVYLLEN